MVVKTIDTPTERFIIKYDEKMCQPTEEAYRDNETGHIYLFMDFPSGIMILDPNGKKHFIKNENNSIN